MPFVTEACRGKKESLLLLSVSEMSQSHFRRTVRTLSVRRGYQNSPAHTRTHTSVVCPWHLPFSINHIFLLTNMCVCVTLSVLTQENIFPVNICTTRRQRKGDGGGGTLTNKAVHSGTTHVPPTTTTKKTFHFTQTNIALSIPAQHNRSPHFDDHTHIQLFYNLNVKVQSVFWQRTQLIPKRRVYRLPKFSLSVQL